MKFVIEKNSLIKSLGHVQGVVERRNTMLILANVLIEAEGDRIRLTTTDMELEFVEELGAEVIQPGKVTAPAVLIHDYVRKLDDGSQVEVSLSSDGERLWLRSGRSSLNQPTMPAGDFPLMDKEDFTHHFTISALDMRGLFERARFAISTEETRYYLNGVYFHATEDAKQIRAVATDGHRMARIERPLPQGAEKMPAVIVPRKTVSELGKLLDEGNQDVSVSVGQNKIRFEMGDLTLSSKLIDGRFPDYERVIPKQNKIQLDVDQKLLRNAIDRVSTVSTERTRTVKMKIEGGRAILTAAGQDHGEAEEEIAVEFRHDPLTVGFNSRYLMDILSNISGPRANFLMDVDTSPIIITDPDDTTMLFLLMPLRV